MNDKKEQVKVIKETWQYTVHYKNMGGRGVQVSVLPLDEVTRLETQGYFPGDVAKTIAQAGCVVDNKSFIVPERILQVDFELVENA